jgi:hypothetical protein
VVALSTRSVTITIRFNPIGFAVAPHESHSPVEFRPGVCEPEKLPAIMRQDTPVGKTVDSMIRNG